MPRTVPRSNDGPYKQNSKATRSAMVFREVNWDQRDVLDFACFETTALKPSGGKA